MNNFNNAKSVVKYINENYGNKKIRTVEEQISFKKSMKKDHTLEEIKMMKRRIDGEISAEKDLNYLNNHIITFLVLLLTTLSPLFINALTQETNFFGIFLNKSLNGKTITQNQLAKIFGSINFSPLYQTVLHYYEIIFLILFLFISSYIIFMRKVINKLYSYSILIEEMIEEEKADEKQANKETIFKDLSIQ